MDKKRQHISLEDVGRQLPFTVPEHYFEDFAGRITTQIFEPHVPFRRMAKSWLYMAAMFAGVFLLGNLAYALYQRNTSLKIENYERYLLSQVDDVALLDLYLEDFTDNY